MKPLKLKLLPTVLIIATGVIIRLININQPLLEFFPPRQTQTAEITRNIYKNGWQDFWTPKVRYLTGSPVQFVVEFPLYNGLVALLYHFFGPSVIWGRVVSLISFVGSTLIFYRLLRTGPDFSPEKSAGTSEPHSRDTTTRGCKPREWRAYCWSPFLFFIFSPLHILISRSFQPEELALFLLLLAIYKKSWAIFSLAALTKLPAILFAPILFYQLYRGGTAFRRVIIGFSASLITPVAWFLRAKALAIHPELIINAQIGNWFQPALWLNSNWYFSLFQIEHIWVLTSLGLLFFWLGFWLIVAERRLLAARLPARQVRQGVSLFDTKFWLVWLTSGLFYLAIFNYHAMTHEYYHLFLLPPLSIFVGIGINQIVKITKGFSKYVRVVSAAGILLLFIMGLIQPAIRKIISAPKSPEESTEITPDRYRLINDF